MVLANTSDPGAIVPSVPPLFSRHCRVTMGFLHSYYLTFEPQFFFLCSRAGESACSSLSDIPPYCSLSIRVGFPSLPCLCFFCQSLCGLSILCCAEIVQSVFSSSSGGIAQYVGIYLVCLWEDASSGSSYPALLDPSLVWIK